MLARLAGTYGQWILSIDLWKKGIHPVTIQKKGQFGEQDTPQFAQRYLGRPDCYSLSESVLMSMIVQTYVMCFSINASFPEECLFMKG